jgi:hypothetical protein
MPNHWRKCNICSRFGVLAGSVELTGFFSFVKPTKALIVMKKIQCSEAFTLCLVGEAIQQTPVMHLCEPNKYIKKWEQQDLSNANIQTKTKEPFISTQCQ